MDTLEKIVHEQKANLRLGAAVSRIGSSIMSVMASSAADRVKAIDELNIAKKNMDEAIELIKQIDAEPAEQKAA